jgi:hypothetical protein
MQLSNIAGVVHIYDEGVELLSSCLDKFKTAYPDAGLIVISDGANENFHPIAKFYNAFYFKGKRWKTKYYGGMWTHRYLDICLEKHKDVAACTYSLDLCVYQITPWDLYVEGVPYTLQENQALLYYGEAQRHWREDFPNPKNNIVCNVFFFYVEPNHWSIVEPKEKHDMIRRQNAIERNLS